MCCWTNLRYLEYYQTWTWPKIINSIVLGAYSLNENLQNLLSTAPVLASSSSCKESKALVLPALQSFFCDTCRQKQLTLGTVPEPLAASSPRLPVPAWPRQLKNAKKGPVAEGKENTDFLLSRDTLQLRRAAKIPRSSSLYTWMVGRIPELWIKYKPVRKCLLTIRPWAVSYASNMSWFCFLNASVNLYYYYHYYINF